MDTQALLAQLAGRGYRAQVVPAGRLADLHEAVARWHRQGVLDDELYREYLSGFDPAPPAGLEARSLIVLASPSPPVRVLFHHRGREVPAIIPPTYRWQAARAAELGLLAEVLGPAGYRAERAVVPVKFLAVCSGLARYGRNNITYLPGLGSFCRLAAYYSDLPCASHAWQEPQMLEACAHCTACLHRCPTGAILADRFLVRAERCLTWLNERPNAMPGWVDPAWHNALIGCMRCQEVCPENRPLAGWLETGPAFTEEETALLLQGPAAGELPEETRAKLAALDWSLDERAVLARNLGLLLALPATARHTPCRPSTGAGRPRRRSSLPGR